jgi:hypothetical protein
MFGIIGECHPERQSVGSAPSDCGESGGAKTRSWLRAGHRNRPYMPIPCPDSVAPGRGLEAFDAWYDDRSWLP